jgi:hypothetical protein
MSPKTEYIVLMEKSLDALEEGVKGDEKLYQYHEVSLHGYERQFWKYVQYRRSFPFPAFSSPIAHTDTADEFINRFSGNEHSYGYH